MPEKKLVNGRLVDVYNLNEGFDEMALKSRILNEQMARNSAILENTRRMRESLKPSSGPTAGNTDPLREFLDLQETKRGDLTSDEFDRLVGHARRAKFSGAPDSEVFDALGPYWNDADALRAVFGPPPEGSEWCNDGNGMLCTRKRY